MSRRRKIETWLSVQQQITSTQASLERRQKRIERLIRVMELRHEGHTFEEIGAILGGVSGAQARNLLLQAVKCAAEYLHLVKREPAYWERDQKFRKLKKIARSI